MYYIWRQIRAMILPFTVILVVPGLLVSYLPEWLLFQDGWWRYMGFLPLLGGLIFFSWTVGLFAYEGKGTLAPWDPPSNLVTSGPYGWVRHPMITSVLAILLGEAILFNNLLVFCWFLLFFLVNHINFILIEEPQLIRRFGKDYVAYQKEVPRWLPRL